MNSILKLALAGAAFGIAAPAMADVIQVAPSSQQGTLVHGTGTEQTNTMVTGNLGPGGPNIVNFTGDTTGPGDLLFLQQGQGQADVLGAEITTTQSPNDYYNFLSGNIFLSGGMQMDYIEFALTGLSAGTVDFFITDNDGTVFPFLNQVLGSGNTFFAFDAVAGQLIANVRFVADTPPGEITTIKQVRIIAAPAIPEPGTWAMMLLGFAAAGIAIRRQRRPAELPQLA